MAITNDKLYEAINNTRREILSTLKEEIDPIKKDVDELKGWRNRVVGQFSIIMVFIGAGVNWLFDQFLPKK
jgi:hypothetical protein